MPYSIILSKPWRYRHPRRGRSILEAGRYRVPDQVPEVVAEQAVAEGMARREALFGEIFDRSAVRPVARGSAMTAPVAPAAPVQPPKNVQKAPTRRTTGRGRSRKAAVPQQQPA